MIKPGRYPYGKLKRSSFFETMNLGLLCVVVIVLVVPIVVLISPLMFISYLLGLIVKKVCKIGKLDN